MIIKKNEKGFTLIEVIISVAIIGILLVVLNQFMWQSYKVINLKGKDTNLIYAAQKELDNAISNPQYVSQDNRLSIKRKNNVTSTINVNGVSTDVTGTLIEVVSNSKTILSTFIPN